MGTFKQVAVSSSGAVATIADTVLASSAAAVSFTNIPSGYRHLPVTASTRASDSGTGGYNLVCQCNGDTGANYDWDDFNFSGSTTSGVATELYNQSWVGVGRVTRGGNAAGYAAAGTILFANYGSTSLYKEVLYDCVNIVGTASGNIKRIIGAGVWRSTAAITSLTFLSDGGVSFAGGTAFTLYGVV